MRKAASIFAIASVVAILAPPLSVAASPRPRQVFERVCEIRQKDGNEVEVCVMFNRHDILDYKIEASSTVKGIGLAIERIQWGWVRLLRASDGVQLRGTSGTGFVVTLDPTGPGLVNHSTTWFGICDIGHPLNGSYRATARYRIKWVSLPGDPLGEWHTISSTHSFPC